MCIAVEVGLEKRRYLLFASPGSNTVFGYCLIIVKVLNCIQAYLLTGQSDGRLMILHISGPADGFPNAITEILNFA